NVHGNIRGANGAHVSNQGWGKWEVNLSKVLVPNALTTTPNPLAPAAEWQNLFVGIGNPAASNVITARGRYGWPPPGSPAGTIATPDDPLTYGAGGNYAQPGTAPHLYGQADFDGGTAAGGATFPLQLPSQVLTTNAIFTTFPAFQNPATGASFGYDNGNLAE